MKNIKIVLFITLIFCLIKDQVIYPYKSESIFDNKNYTYTNKTRIMDYLEMEKIPVYIDSDLEEDHQKQIVVAIDEWNHVFNGYVSLYIKDYFPGHIKYKLAEQVHDSNYGIMFLMLSYKQVIDAKIFEDNDESKRVIAFSDMLGGHFITIIKDRYSYRNFKAIILHELGHIFSAEHIRIKNLMHPEYSKACRCIDKITVAQAALFFDIPLNKLNYCRIPNFD